MGKGAKRRVVAEGNVGAAPSPVLSFVRHAVRTGGGMTPRWSAPDDLDGGRSPDAVVVPLDRTGYARRARFTFTDLPAAPTPERRLLDPAAVPPDAALIGHYGAVACLRDGVLPWRRMQGQTVVLTEATTLPPATLAALRDTFGAVRLARAAPGTLGPMLARLAGPALAAAAETRCPAAQSCRSWNFRRAQGVGIAVLLTLTLLAVSFPGPLIAGLALWSAATLLCNTALKVAAVASALRAPPQGALVAAAPQVTPFDRAAREPVITLLVPLYREREIASHLLARLTDLDYPRDRLDVLLILEDDDALTHATLTALDLPDWVRIVAVPEGTLRTKPRALNHALTLARGDIVGIYDAEDAPAPDQLRAVARRFAIEPPEVACLQGVLDYYNTSCNWLARCFTLEYATWFRLMLPGLARLGLVVPLGGTTLFLRRAAIEAVGGWDAHNVTEDADLGLRLARAGYRTELVASVTIEEANARLWPWVRQRTRWLKGYAMTWAVHMADPAALWRDLGPRRFWGVQILFLGTVSQFVLAPVLWSFWLIPFGLPHPLRGMLPEAGLLALGALFLATELINLAVATLAARRAGRPRLAFWSPMLQLYFPLATISAWRALTEICTKPFFWDKTVHGVFLPHGGGRGPGEPKTAIPATLPIR